MSTEIAIIIMQICGLGICGVIIAELFHNHK